MDRAVAINLISKGVSSENPERWADLGAGSGTFTAALASLLKDGSTIYAVDQNAKALNQIPVVEGREIVKVTEDIVRYVAELADIDGILLANALHFVKDQEYFLRTVRKSLKSTGRLLIVEYDMDDANTWVPYPVSFCSLQKLLTRSGLGTAEKIGTARSRYQAAGMYAVRVVINE